MKFVNVINFLEISFDSFITSYQFFPYLIYALLDANVALVIANTFPLAIPKYPCCNSRITNEPFAV